MQYKKQRKYKMSKIKANEFIISAIEMSGKKQNEIAEDMGYTNANIISMLKKGNTKLAPAKIPLFAKAVGIDPVRVLDVLLSEYQPEIWDVIKNIMHEPLTENELDLLFKMRDVTKGSDPKLASRTDSVKFNKNKLTFIFQE